MRLRTAAALLALALPCGASAQQDRGLDEEVFGGRHVVEGDSRSIAGLRVGRTVRGASGWQLQVARTSLGGGGASVDAHLLDAGYAWRTRADKRLVPVLHGGLGVLRADVGGGTWAPTAHVGAGAELHFTRARHAFLRLDVRERWIAGDLDVTATEVTLSFGFAFTRGQ